MRANRGFQDQLDAEKQDVRISKIKTRVSIEQAHH